MGISLTLDSYNFVPSSKIVTWQYGRRKCVIPANGFSLGAIGAESAPLIGKRGVARRARKFFRVMGETGVGQQ